MNNKNRRLVYVSAWAALGSAPLFLAACGGDGSSTSTTGTPLAVADQKTPAALSTVTPSVAASYTVINLSQNPQAKISPTGQVAYLDGTGNTAAPYFFDGTTPRAIPVMPGSIVSTVITGINASGKVIGCTSTSEYGEQAWSWTPAGGLVMLPTLGGNASCVKAIHANGNMAGRTRDTAGVDHAVIWKPTGLIDLGGLARGATAYAINGLDQVTGVGQTGSGSQNAIYASPIRTLLDLGPFIDGTSSTGYAINDSGLVVGGAGGVADYGGGPRYGTRAFAWSDADGMVLWGGTGSVSTAFGVNNAGMVVGGWPAFVWTASGGIVWPAALTPGAISFLTNVNNQGVAGGNSQVGGSSGTHGILWTAADGLIDVNGRIQNVPSGFEVYDVLGVADSGEVLVTASTGLALLKSGVVSNAAPSLGVITSNGPVPIGTAAFVSASFTDPDKTDTHTGSWSWGDSTAASAGQITEVNGAGTIKGAHTFSKAGVYPVSVTVTDSQGKLSTVSGNVVVFDPSAGFVTGGGSVVSPPGAYKANPASTGKADFAFVAKYQKGATAPMGNAEFTFTAGNLSFKSTTYDWLVVGDARAQYAGTGTINGAGGYKFTLTAVDGALLAKGTADRLRLRVWHTDSSTNSDVVDYDNQVGSDTEGTLLEGAAIASGSIVLHK